MKQGNGTDVLGLNDLRNASIGVIYVSPNDEKKNVLSAILTQEKLGRKQVAVVLPDQNKAFQRPGDFDDLKSLRGKLQTQIVFISPGGPGPAAFARQRNFPVYSTLEIFAKALKDEKQPPPENKKGWLFGSGKQKAVTPATPVVPATPALVEAGTYVAPLSGEEEPVSYNDHVVPLVLGGAEVKQASGTADTADGASNDRDIMKPSPNHTPVQDDWHALAPHTEVPATPISSTGSAPQSASDSQVQDGLDEGTSDIILLEPKRPRMTVKLSATKGAVGALTTIPLAKSEKVPVSRASRRSSGKVAAVGTGVAGGMAAASLARTAGVGNAPPPRASANSGNGGNGGNSGRPRRGALLIGLAALLVLTTAVLGGIALSAPNTFAPLKTVIPQLTTSTTVTIVPSSKTENNNYLIRGVQSNPDSSKQEVLARVITVNSDTQSKTVSATGVRQTAATAATGTITFYNSLSTSVTVGVTVFTLSSGVKFENNGNAVVPAGNLPTVGQVTVNAHAITLGSRGNISARAYYGACCTSGITAVSGAFSGGQDAQNYTFVQQSDINGAVNALQPGLLTQAEALLKQSIHSNEQAAGSTTCYPTTSANQNVGDKASNVTVSVKVTCQEQVYDQKGTLALVTNLLKAKAMNDYGANYVLAGNVVTQAKVQNVSNGIVNLLVSAKGIWAYQFTDTLQQQLKNAIKGKSVADAVTYLESQTGVASASISPSTGTLPTSTDNIKFVIQSVTGMSGGGSTGAPNGTPTVTGPGSTTPTTQPGLGVGGS